AIQLMFSFRDRRERQSILWLGLHQLFCPLLRASVMRRTKFPDQPLQAIVLELPKRSSRDKPLQVDGISVALQSGDCILVQANVSIGLCAGGRDEQSTGCAG